MQPCQDANRASGIASSTANVHWQISPWQQSPAADQRGCSLGCLRSCPAPLQQVAREATVMDCADGKTHLCFPILLAWIADHAEHAALQGIGTKSCPKWEVPCEKLGGDPRRMYETPDYMLYREKAWRHEPAEAARIAEYFQWLGGKI